VALAVASEQQADAQAPPRRHVHGARHLYVHLPFCVHRCGYCDFVTVVGRRDDHEPYVEALLTELDREREVLAEPLDSVFVGGGTPTFTRDGPLRALLRALPAAAEVTVEANPETVTRELATLLRDCGVTRVSLGAQSFQAELLSVLERRAGPDHVRQAVHHLRDAGFDNISLDLLYGIPGQEPSQLDADLAEALALEPEHLSCYELEAKPGTRFTHEWGGELERQADALEGYFERVVETLVGAGLRWYETANFCRLVDGRDLRARHNLGYWHGDDYLGVGIGAVSTIGMRRRRNSASLGRYVSALAAGRSAPHAIEELDEATKRRELLMLALRLDEPLPRARVDEAVDRDALERLVAHGLVEPLGRGDAIRLTRRGRLLGDGVTAELLAVF
jgi:putative oxygen-independent coproporphyrinogen III oxidase